MTGSSRSAPSDNAGERRIRKVSPRRAVSAPTGPVRPVIDPTSDDRDLEPPARARGATDSGEPQPLTEQERWLLEERPPHWG